MKTEKKNPNEHFIAVSKLAMRLSGLDLHNPMQLIELNVGLANLATLANIALNNERKTFRDSNFRPVVDLEVEGNGEDAFFSAATYDDDGSPVSDDELDYLTETYSETVAEEAYQNAVCAAEYAFEGDR